MTEFITNTRLFEDAMIKLVAGLAKVVEAPPVDVIIALTSVISNLCAGTSDPRNIFSKVICIMQNIEESNWLERTHESIVNSHENRTS